MTQIEHGLRSSKTGLEHAEREADSIESNEARLERGTTGRRGAISALDFHRQKAP